MPAVSARLQPRFRCIKKSNVMSDIVTLSYTADLQAQDSSPGGLRPSTLPLGHRLQTYIESLRVSGEDNLFLRNLNVRAGDEPAISDLPSK